MFGLFGFAGFTLIALALQAGDILFKTAAGQPACPGVAPLIPGVEIPNVPITIPLYGWLVLLIILTVHEGMHGVVARRAGIKVKNAGIILISFLPIGAFVEPDEKQLRQGDERSALRVFAAGPTANILSLAAILAIALVVVYSMSIFVSPWAAPIQRAAFGGVVIEQVDENVEFCRMAYPSPAYGVMKEGQIIEEINDINITSTNRLALVLMEHRYEPLTFTLRNPDGSVVEETLTPNGLGSYGISKVSELENPDFEIPEMYRIYTSARSIFFEFLDWLFLLSLLVAIVNFLPLAVFDGGRMANIIFPPYFGWLGRSKKDTENLIGRVSLWLLLGLLFINALPLFI
jgi:membrane-associated protease RseP (regulator of RpoE activity)